MVAKNTGRSAEGRAPEPVGETERETGRSISTKNVDAERPGAILLKKDRTQRVLERVVGVESQTAAKKSDLAKNTAGEADLRPG